MRSAEGWPAAVALTAASDPPGRLDRLMADYLRDEVLAGLAPRDAAFLVRTAIPSGHKVALRTIEEGQPVHKYGQVIGVATSRILGGEHVHDHNLMSLSRRPALPTRPPIPRRVIGGA